MRRFSPPLLNRAARAKASPCLTPPIPQLLARPRQSVAGRRRAGVRDGGHRRHHPADRKRPLDHRVEAHQRRHSAALPPDWERAFDLYRQTPQYREVAGPAGMTLSGFKFIFFWEWCTGCSAACLASSSFIGVGWFAVSGNSARLRLAARGFVHSRRAAGRGRLVHGPVGPGGPDRGQPLRLSAHLLFALFLFAALIWTALDLRRADRVRRALPHGAWSRLPPSSSS